ncbi:hypothetical protein BDV29DRAFT_187961 [Aspergillus leporis]|uniref:Uncharacterized protein n=1 Tax=Aspergillus leporis TaxID=41062 RepID=A0A5N5XGE6_9EURO|nr:hypothetical protein BDV29DRAFT_187961 [Aspergillus leporis]
MSTSRSGSSTSPLIRNGLGCLEKVDCRLLYVHVNPDGLQESDAAADDDDEEDEDEEDTNGEEEGQASHDNAGSNVFPSPRSLIQHKYQKPQSFPALASADTRDSRNYSIANLKAVTSFNGQSPQSASYHAQVSTHDYLPQPTSQSTYGFPPQRDHYRLGPLKGVPRTFSDASYTTDLQEACLIRYFVENLAPWFEATDRDRHLTLTVPGRAMFCPVLRYALFTASAGHTRKALKCRNNINGTATFDGISLLNHSEGSAICYHNICISYLIEISKDPKDPNADYNEDVLTASATLCFYEQIDAPSTGTDTEAYLKAVQFIVETQNDPSFYAAHTIHSPPHERNIHSSPAISLRHSACLIAPRQEIWSALHQHPNSYPTHEARVRKWMALKSFETAWEAHKPSSFKPVFYQPSNPGYSRYFQTIWHMNDSQVLAEQHMKLSRVLLAMSNPGIPRLGAGAGALNRGLEAELRAITRKVVGLGMSNRGGPALVTSAEALVRFLRELEFAHASPTGGIVGALRRA